MFELIYIAYLYSFLSILVITFQFALVFGAPWGEITMGGKYTGRIPLYMRVVIVLVFIPILICCIIIVLVRSGLIFESYYPYSQSAIWGVVVFAALVAILNLITPSKKERKLWGPLTTVLFTCVLYVAMH